MTIEIVFIIMKWVWAGGTALMGGMLLHLWKEYRANKTSAQNRIAKMEQELQTLKLTTVTFDRMDEIIERKIGPIKEQMFKIEQHMQGMRHQQEQDFRELLKAIKEK